MVEGSPQAGPTTLDAWALNSYNAAAFFFVPSPDCDQITTES